MKETTQPRRLTRSRDDRFIGGVAAGIANYFNIDPVLTRVAFVVSIAFGGIGVLAYLALLALVPIEGDPEQPAVQPSGGRRFLVIGGTIVVGCLALASIDGAGFGGWFFGVGPGPLFGILIWGLAIAGVIWLVREATSGDNASSGAFGRRSTPSSPPPAVPPAKVPFATATSDPATPPEPADQTTELAGDEVRSSEAEVRSSEAKTSVLADSPTQNAPTSATMEMKPGVSTTGRPTPQQNPGGSAGSTIGKIMTWCAIGISALTLFIVMAAVSTWVTAEFGAIPMAAVVILFGAGLVAAALQNRRQLAAWMLASALVIAVPMAIVSIADLRIDGGYGDLSEEPRLAVDIPDDGYKLAAGALTVDLRSFDFRRGETLELPIRSGIGAVSVIVPDRVCVSGRVEGKAGLADVRGVEASGAAVDRTFTPGTGRAPQVRLDGDFKLGFFEVIDNTTWEQSGTFNGRNDNQFDRGPFEDTSSVGAARQRGTDACLPGATRPGTKKQRLDSSRT